MSERTTEPLAPTESQSTTSQPTFGSTGLRFDDDFWMARTYTPGAVRRKSIPKPDGSQRHLGIPNVMDRLIQQAILQVLTPIFDPGFSESSLGF